MGTNSSAEIFQGQLNKLIENFEGERNRHKFVGLSLKLSTAALAALATVLLGLQDLPAFTTLFKNLALVANALITVFAAYEAFFEPKKLWARETAALNKLKDIRREWDVELAGSPELSPANLRAYQDRVNVILTSNLDSWINDKSAHST